MVDLGKGSGPSMFWQLNTEKKILIVIVICLLEEAGFGLDLEGKVGRQEPLQL